MNELHFGHGAFALAADRRASSRSAGRLALVCAVFCCALFGAFAAQAQARSHEVTWAHHDPSGVSRFVILISPVEGSLSQARQVDVGRPVLQAQGSTNFYSAVVDFEPDEFLAVAAVGHDGRMSMPSEWSGMPPTTPGQPTLAQP